MGLLNSFTCVQLYRVVKLFYLCSALWGCWTLLLVFSSMWLLNSFTCVQLYVVVKLFYLCLALCGWRLGLVEDTLQDAYGIRRIGVWNFVSIVVSKLRYQKLSLRKLYHPSCLTTLPLNALWIMAISSLFGFSKEINTKLLIDLLIHRIFIPKETQIFSSLHLCNPISKTYDISKYKFCQK